MFNFADKFFLASTLFNLDLYKNVRKCAKKPINVSYNPIPVNQTFKPPEEQFETLAEWLDIHLDVS